MAVYKRNYSAYTGTVTPVWTRVLVLARYAFEEAWASKITVGLFIFCLLPCIMSLVVIYLGDNPIARALVGGQGQQMLAIDAKFFLKVLQTQAWLALVMASWIAPRLITFDLADDALPILLSHPISRFGYVFGKFIALFGSLSLITWIPCLLLFVDQAYSSSQPWAMSNLQIAMGLLAGSVIWIAFLSVLGLALSSWVKWRVVATGVIFAAVFVPAGVAGGFRPRQLALPIMLCCALVCVAHFTLSETVSPGLRRRAEFIYERQISGNKNYHQDVKTDVAARVAEGSFISAAELNTQTGEMKKAVYTFEYKGRVRYQVEADTANWRRGRWVFNNALERTFLQSGAMTMRNRAQWDSGVDIEPQLLSADKIWPEDLTLFELLHRISVLKRIGSPFRREEVFAHSKLAAPLINFILCLTALPFAIKVRRAGKMLHFTAALGMAFFFWWVASVFQSTGEAGMLSPIAAAWLPPVVFGAIALFLLKKSGL